MHQSLQDYKGEHNIIDDCIIVHAKKLSRTW